MTIAFFVLLVLFIWVFVVSMCTHVKLSALQRDYDNMVKGFWARNEEFCKLKVRATNLETMVAEMADIIKVQPQNFAQAEWCIRARKLLGRTISDPAQRVFPLTDLPPGVDTAAQVPPRCRHCGRFKENHTKHTKALYCLPTLMPDGRLVESQTHFEPLPPLPPNPPPQPTPDRRREPVIKIPSAKVEIFICRGCGYPVASCHCQS